MKNQPFKRSKIESKYMWQYLLLIGIFVFIFVPLVNTQYLQVCISSDGKIQNVFSQTIKVPLIATVPTQNQTTTFYLIQIKNLPKYLYVYGNVGCNNLYWYYASNGTYTVTINIQAHQYTTWVTTDDKVTTIQVMP